MGAQRTPLRPPRPIVAARPGASASAEAGHAEDGGNAATATRLAGDPGGSGASVAALPLGILGMLLGTAGNRAVSGLITAQRDAAVAQPNGGPSPAPGPAGPGGAAQPPNPYEALDDPDFNAGTITNDLLRAINQSEHTFRTRSTYGGLSWEEDVAAERRKIDVPKVIEVLSNRSASQIAEVKRRYQAYEKRPLETDLFGLGESGRKPDITADQQARIEALLKGTKADPIAIPLQEELAKYPAAVAAQLRRAIGERNDAAAKKNQLEADAIELHELFSKELSDATREQVMALHRRPVAELDAIYGVYAFRYGDGAAVYDITLRLGDKGLHRMRLDELRLGNIAQADAIAIEIKRRQIEALNKADEEYNGSRLGKLAAMTWQGKATLEEHEKQRRALTGDIEGIIELNKREAMKEAGGKAAGVAVAERLQKILGQQDGEIGNTVGSELTRTLGKEHASGITALANPWISSGSESLVTNAAYQLLAMERDHTTNAPRIIATLRSFPGLAQHDIMARVRDPNVSAAEKERIGADPQGAVRALSHRYTDMYRDEYDRIREGGRSYDQIVESAGEADRTLMQDLRYGGGETSDLGELQHAMGKKDVEAVKAILKRQPNREKIDELVASYNSLGEGRDLRKELFGKPPEEGVSDADWAIAGAGKMFGQDALLAGRDAAQVDELLRKPSAEQLSGKATIGFMGIPKAPGQPEIEWAAAGAEKEYQATMANRGVTGRVREWGGDPETEKILKKTRADIPDLVKQWQAARDPAAKAHLRSEIMKARATLSGDADAYEKDNAAALAAFQSALQFAVSIALAVALPGAGAGLVAFLESTALNIAANVASNFVIKGGDYGWADLKGDVLGGVLGAAGGKFGEEVLGKVAQRVFAPAAKATTETAGKFGIETVLAREAGAAIKTSEKVAIGIEEFETKEAGQAAVKALAGGEEKAAQEAARIASQGGDVAAVGERANVAVAGEAGAAGREAGAAGREAGATGREAGAGSRAAGSETAAGSKATGAAGPAGKAELSVVEKWAREIGAFWGGLYAPKAMHGDWGLSLTEVLQALAATGAGKWANARRTKAALAAKEEAARNKAPEAAGPERAPVPEGGERPGPEGVVEPRPDTESEALAHEGQQERTPTAEGLPGDGSTPPPDRPPLNADAFGPLGPDRMLANNGIPPDGATGLQLVADQRNLVIRARPRNVASMATVAKTMPEGGARPKAAGVAKPELVKAKTLNRVDMLIGGPAGQEGKVGFFEPKLPSREILEAMTDKARAAVEERARQRQEEYDHYRDEYARLAADGLVRIKDGVLQVADPRTASTEGAPRGEFKDVGGDIDIFDITHADGTPLTDHERAAITTELRSLGIDVEHGFHMAWKKDSPGTHVPAVDAAIVAQHLADTPLVAFVPISPPREVWADTVVHGPPRTEGTGDRFMPLKGARVTGPKEGPVGDGIGTGPDIKAGETDFSDVAGPGGHGGQSGPTPGGPSGPTGPGGPAHGGPTGPGGPAGPGSPAQQGGVHERFDVSDVRPGEPDQPQVEPDDAFAQSAPHDTQPHEGPAPPTDEAIADLGEPVEPPAPEDLTHLEPNRFRDETQPGSAGAERPNAPEIGPPAWVEVHQFGGTGAEGEGLSPKRVLRGPDGRFYLFKGAHGEASAPYAEAAGVQQGERYRRAAAGALLMQRAGYNTPNVELVTFAGEPGSLQPWDPNLAPDRPNRSEDVRRFRDSQAGRDLDAVDFVLGSLDRHMGNFKIEYNGDQPRLTVFDNDAAMPPSEGRFSIFHPDLMNEQMRTAGEAHRRNAAIEHQGGQPTEAERLEADTLDQVGGIPGRPRGGYQREVPAQISKQLVDRFIELSRDFPEAELRRWLTSDEVAGVRARLDDVMKEIFTGTIRIVP